MPSRTALAIRHVPFEDLGVWEPVLAARGYDIAYLDVGADPIDADRTLAAELLVVLGGPIGVYDVEAYPALKSTSAAIAGRLRTGGPTIGVCLGAQLIAEVLGAPVRSTGRVEIGFAPLDLTPEGHDSPLRELQDEPVLHWHGDEFAIPVGARHLARTPGFPNQAFSTDTTLALQFHLEADPQRIERWLIGHAHELAHHGIDPRAIREQARVHGPRLAQLATRVLDEWLDEQDRRAEQRP